mmetsp:Transcript_94251/g.282612  ORF Transcript_94251/g.282612 Transcript_94251/m.282612 type:complete len:370 (-) Transcript_94251:665-1774(-)
MLLDAATGQPLQGRKFTEDEFKPFRTELRDNASGNKVVLELNHCIKAGIDGEECVFVPTMVRVGGLIATPRCKVAMLPLDLLRFQDTAGGCRWRMQPHGGRLRAANDPNLVEDGQPLEKSIYTTRCLQMLPLQDVAADAKLRLIVPKKDVFERPAKIALQAFLKERGFYKGPINGDFGDGGAFGNWQVLWRKDKLNPGWKSTWALQHLVASPEEDPRVPDQQRQDGIACRFGEKGAVATPRTSPSPKHLAPRTSHLPSTSPEKHARAFAIAPDRSTLGRGAAEVVARPKQRVPRLPDRRHLGSRDCAGAAECARDERHHIHQSLLPVCGRQVHVPSQGCDAGVPKSARPSRQWRVIQAVLQRSHRWCFW